MGSSSSTAQKQSGDDSSPVHSDGDSHSCCPSARRGENELHLDFSSRKLKSISISSLQAAAPASSDVHVDLSHNLVKRLPSSIGALHAITSLDLSHNRITSCGLFACPVREGGRRGAVAESPCSAD